MFITARQKSMSACDISLPFFQCVEQLKHALWMFIIWLMGQQVVEAMYCVSTQTLELSIVEYCNLTFYDDFKICFSLVRYRTCCT